MESGKEINLNEETVNKLVEYIRALKHDQDKTEWDTIEHSVEFKLLVVRSEIKKGGDASFLMLLNDVGKKLDVDKEKEHDNPTWDKLINKVHKNTDAAALRTLKEIYLDICKVVLEVGNLKHLSFKYSKKYATKDEKNEDTKDCVSIMAYHLCSPSSLVNSKIITNWFDFAWSNKPSTTSDELKKILKEAGYDFDLATKKIIQLNAGFNDPKSIISILPKEIVKIIESKFIELSKPEIKPRNYKHK